MNSTSLPNGEVLPPKDIRWWTLSSDEALRQLASDGEWGLDDAESSTRLEQFGRNELAEEPPDPLWQKIGKHLQDVFVWVLVAAAIISAVIGDWIDMAAILAIVVLNVVIGFVQEERAGRALAALRRLSSPVVRAIRNGSLTAVDARDIVPGDVVEIEAGDHIPADVRLLKSFEFRAQEASLTGESTPVDKDAKGTLDEDVQLADRRNLAFMGTVAAAGRARAVVVATGMSTELGQIAGMLQRHQPESTPLQRRLAELGRALIVVCLAVIAVVFALHLYRGGAFLEVLLLSISLAVAAVPEGLPAVVTLTLAVGLQRMVKRNALIRSLPSVETLGAVTVICTDKTGTLTRNEMTVREVFAGGRQYEVTGTGYEPAGDFLAISDGASPPPSSKSTDGAGDADSRGQQTVELEREPDLVQALTIGARCNEASLHGPDDRSDGWSIVGDPTEGALLVVAMKAGVNIDRKNHDIVHEIPFDSDRKAMSIVLRGEDSRSIMYTKGAPEVILSKCTSELMAGKFSPLADERRRQIRSVGTEMAARALRVLALAYRDVGNEPAAECPENELVFAGLVGMIDPPREEAIEGVRRCRAAGIRPVMITGDHPETALAIARETGIALETDKLVTGADLDNSDDDDLTAHVADISVYARVTAAHKLRVVNAWQKNGDIVAMTGDGVNDAPAVRAADIGIAMGITGSDVTKDTADMVLTDDNFASIVNAVEEGRGIFDNIQKFVHYLLACNAGEVMLVFLAGIAGWPTPLNALQILWINLVTDGMPALALGMEPPERNVMQRPPRNKREPVIDWSRGFQILRHGLLMASTSAAAFWWIYQDSPDRLLLAQSTTFCIVAYMQLLYSLACRSRRDTTPEAGMLSNYYLLVAIVASAIIQFAIIATPATRSVFELDQRVLSQWLFVLTVSLLPVSLIEAMKLIRRLFSTKAP